MAVVRDRSRISLGKLWGIQDDEMGSLVGTTSISAADCRSSVHAFDGTILSGSLAAADRHRLRCFPVRPDVLRFSDLSASP